MTGVGVSTGVGARIGVGEGIGVGIPRIVTATREALGGREAYEAAYRRGLDRDPAAAVALARRVLPEPATTVH